MNCRDQRPQDFLECIVDLREYDVPYHVRFAIDTGKLEPSPADAEILDNSYLTHSQTVSSSNDMT